MPYANVSSVVKDNILFDCENYTADIHAFPGNRDI